MGTSIRQQQDERMYMEFKDKHNRLYHTQIEKKTGEPCQALRPIDWTAPRNPPWMKGLLLPPEDLDIMTMVPQAARTRKGYQVEIRYDVWLEKWDSRNEDWDKKLADFARGMTKSQNPVELLRNPTPELLKFVGTRPFPPREFIMAAAAGNEWALGLTDRIPAKAQAILDVLAPIYSISKRERRIGMIYDPFAEDAPDGPVRDDDAPEEDDLPLSMRQAAAVDPLGEDKGSLASFVVGQQLEEQFDPESVGNGKVTKPVDVDGGKGKPKNDKKKSPRAEAIAGG